MPIKEWIRPPRHLLVMFFALTLLTTAALGWLSWQLLRQERGLENQRLQERRENAVDLAAAALERNLSGVEEQLTALTTLPAADLAQKASHYASQLSIDANLVIFQPTVIDSYPTGGLLYYPFQPPTEEPSTDLFAEAEIAEFQQKDHGKAIAALAGLARARSPSVQAAALLRLGRNLRKSGRWLDALDAYERLERLGSVPVGGIPAGLVARHTRCVVLEQTSDPVRLKQAASALYSDLQSGRWRISRGAYEFYVEEARRWLGTAVSGPSPDAAALAAAVESLWDRWQTRPIKGRQATRLGEQPLLLLWRNSSNRMAALVAGPKHIQSHFLASVKPTLEAHGVRIALADPEGRPVLGPLDGSDHQHALRLASSTGLPWTLHAMSERGVVAADPSRRWLLLAGLCAIALLVVGGSYLIGRAVGRELAVARLQSDFVSAVSHEFRTPLTCLRQISELLTKGRVDGEECRQQYYEVLERESARLHRLVEGLLNFGRIEAGVLHYRLEPLDPATLLRSVTSEFQAEFQAPASQIELNTNGSGSLVRADREALGCVIWNLLDNAVKYSPDCPTVWVDLAQEGKRVAIRVRDRGIGIPPEEQRKIFNKFVRGAAARNLSVRGTGIGLAVASEIVAQHGGEITVRSEPGAGSTFSVLLPMSEP